MFFENGDIVLGIIFYSFILLLGFFIGYFVNHYLLLILGCLWVYSWFCENSSASRHPDVPPAGIILLLVLGIVIFFSLISFLFFQWYATGLFAKILTAVLIIWICRIIGPLFYNVHKNTTNLNHSIPH